MLKWPTLVGWNRRTKWTPLLQSQREFQRSLSKERSRVERNGSCFGFIILRCDSLSSLRPQTIEIAKLLHRRLRDTDEKGHLGPGRIGVVLPETGVFETQSVLDELLVLAEQRGISVQGEAFVYPDRDDNGATLGTQEEQSGAASQPAGKANDFSRPLAMMLPEYPLWKRAIDVSGSLTGLAVGAPLFASAAVLVRLSSKGPIIFSQERTGFLGKPFRIYKFRTMVQNAEDLKAGLEVENERDGPAFKMKNDPRTTRVGRFLRATGIDELPQLYNVLKGDMALVGPRPLPVAEAEQCNRWQQRRQECRPGLTCSWQISKNRCPTFCEWMRLDLGYARKVSPVQDAKLIAKTFASVFLGRIGH